MASYKVLSSKTAQELEERVTSYMKQGWKPTGGISIVTIQESPTINTIWFSQALYLQGPVTLP